MTKGQRKLAFVWLLFVAWSFHVAFCDWEVREAAPFRVHLLAVPHGGFGTHPSVGPKPRTLAMCRFRLAKPASIAAESGASADRRRVLMISYAFPPAGGSGVQRTTKFAKFLPEFGWRPTVWSTKQNPSLPRDETLLDDLPSTLDHRTRTRWDVSTWPHHFAKATDSWMRRLSGRHDWGGSVSWRSEAWLASALRLLAPDEDVCWALGSFSPMLHLIRRENQRGWIS